MVARRLLPVCLVLASLCALPAGSARAQGLAGAQAQAARLKAAVAAEQRKISATASGLADAQRRLDVLSARAARRQKQLDDTQSELVKERVHLTLLERKEAHAETELAQNLRSTYEDGAPNFVTVVMDANGFSDLLERLDFYKRVAKHNANILDVTRQARKDTSSQAKQLAVLRDQYSSLAKAAVDDANEAYVVKSALLQRQEAQLRVRDGAASQLAAVRGRIARIQKAQAAAARAAVSASSATSAAPSSFSGSGGDVVARVVAAANQIATLPYIWGGGHASFKAAGYDCSGSVSYALAAGGLLSSPLDSTGFESWGEPGVGRRITVYANAVHAFMIVDGRRFDTSALSGGGTRWTTASRSTAGFVARHPPGL